MPDTDSLFILAMLALLHLVSYWWWLSVNGFGLILKVRSYLRARAGLPPVTVGHGVLNQGHRFLYERELVFLHDVLPKDAVVHDGLQLLDGANGRRHLVDADVAVVAAAPAAASAPTFPAIAPAAPGTALPEPRADVILPTPPQAVRLAPLPTGVPVLPCFGEGLNSIVRRVPISCASRSCLFFLSLSVRCRVPLV